MTKDNQVERRILENAMNEFITKGYKGAGMQSIANEANVNIALVHYYFRSKKNLYETVVAEIMKEILPPLAQALMQESTIEKKLKAFVDCYINIMQARPSIMLFIIHELANNKESIISRISMEFKMAVMQTIMALNLAKPELTHEQVISHFISILSLLCFPYVASEIFKNLLNVSTEDYVRKMIDRKAIIYNYIDNTLLGEQNT